MEWKSLLSYLYLWMILQLKHAWKERELSLSSASQFHVGLEGNCIARMWNYRCHKVDHQSSNDRTARYRQNRILFRQFPKPTSLKLWMSILCFTCFWFLQVSCKSKINNIKRHLQDNSWSAEWYQTAIIQFSHTMWCPVISWFTNPSD